MGSGFTQATIKIADEKLFAELKGAVERVFSPPAVERFLRQLTKKGIGVRDFERVLAEGLIEQADAVLAEQKKTAKGLYEALPASDQSQVREFYLVRLEQVDVKWRAKFAPAYRVL